MSPAEEAGTSPGQVLRMAGRMGLLDPARLLTTGAAFGRWGPTVATLYAATAARHPTRPAVIDHRGSLSFARLDARSTVLAGGLAAIGLKRGQKLGLLCHNHRDFVEANIAAAKAGLDVVYLNTGFAGPQLADVVDREEVAGLVVDAALLDLVAESGIGQPVVIADGDADEGAGSAPPHSMRAVRKLGRRRPPLRVPRQSNPVLLTSGTTGLPKGAQRSAGGTDARAATGIFERIPYRQGDVFVIPSPLFHAWGLSQLMIAAALGSTVVLARRFTTDDVIRSVIEHRATVLGVVPVMLQRLLAEPDLALEEMTSLRIVASSGSALPAPVAEAWMDRVGDTLYNLYGSTEVGQATIATPQDMRAAPGTCGRVVPGSEVVIVDPDGKRQPTGEQGRIFVGNGAQFAGYTGGGGKEMIDGLMSSGDVGYFDDDGRLFVTGRADDMIVSGGENVFPVEIEEVILAMAEVADAAVIGVADEEFGQRLAAYVVRSGDGTLDAKAVKKRVRAQLARHKVPRDVRFVDELPRNPAGKLLRHRLAD